MLISPALAHGIGGAGTAVGPLILLAVARVRSCLRGPEKVAQAQAKARWQRQIAVYQGWGRLSPGDLAAASCEAKAVDQPRTSKERKSHAQEP